MAIALRTFADSAVNRQLLNEIPARFQQLVDGNEIPGAVLLLVHQGEPVLLRSVGYQRLDTRQPMRTDSIFQIMSMTKPVTAAAVMILVEQGKVVLTDPVEKNLPEFRDQAGHIVEVVSGEPYEKFVAERILLPLGMKDSFFFPDERRIPRIAALYRAQDGSFVSPGGNVLGGDPDKFRKGAKYSAPEFGLYSTAADLAAFYQIMLNGGTYEGKKLLSSSSVAAMTSVQTGSMETKDLGFGTGLGFMVAKDPNAGLDLLSPGSFGHAGAFGTWVFADRSKDLIGVVLIQLTGPNNVLAQHVFTAMVNAAIVRPDASMQH